MDTMENICLFSSKMIVSNIHGYRCVTITDDTQETLSRRILFRQDSLWPVNKVKLISLNTGDLIELNEVTFGDVCGESVHTSIPTIMVVNCDTERQRPIPFRVCRKASILYRDMSDVNRKKNKSMFVQNTESI